MKNSINALAFLGVVSLLSSCATYLTGADVPPEINDTIERRLPSVVLGCHRKEIGPPLKNVNYKIKMKFRVNSLGKMEGLDFEPVESEAEIPLRTTFRCIERRFKKMKFPHPPKGKKVEVQRNLNFETLFAESER